MEKGVAQQRQDKEKKIPVFIILLLMLRARRTNQSLGGSNNYEEELVGKDTSSGEKENENFYFSRIRSVTFCPLRGEHPSCDRATERG